MQDDRSAGTGVERVARWVDKNREPAPGGRGGVINCDKAPDLLAGNEANAAVVATAAAREVCSLFLICSSEVNDCSYSHLGRKTTQKYFYEIKGTIVGRFN